MKRRSRSAQVKRTSKVRFTWFVALFFQSFHIPLNLLRQIAPAHIGKYKGTIIRRVWEMLAHEIGVVEAAFALTNPRSAFHLPELVHLRANVPVVNFPNLLHGCFG